MINLHDIPKEIEKLDWIPRFGASGLVDYRIFGDNNVTYHIEYPLDTTAWQLDTTAWQTGTWNTTTEITIPRDGTYLINGNPAVHVVGDIVRIEEDV